VTDLLTTTFICSPGLVGLAVVGIVLLVSGARKRNGHTFSLGLIFLGAPSAVVLLLLSSFVGWEMGDELSDSQQMGRILLAVLGVVAAAFAALGLIGAVKKDFFWGDNRKNKGLPQEKF
jgi:FtsH-binding integral membrane protein